MCLVKKKSELNELVALIQQTEKESQKSMNQKSVHLILHKEFEGKCSFHRENYVKLYAKTQSKAEWGSCRKS